MSYLRLVPAFCSMLFACGLPAQATTLTFEGVAPAGGSVGVTNAAPYTESGFTLTPTTAAGIFDSGATTHLLGTASASFGFEPSNTVTLTGPTPFDFTSFVFGELSTSASFVSLSIVGNIVGGGTDTMSYSGFGSATLETLNWTNLSSVVFSAVGSTGLDDITVSAARTTRAVPEPLTLFLFGGGLVGLGALRRRRR